MFKLVQKVRKSSCNQKGFTLVELLVVVAIIGILAATLLPKLLGYTNDARVSRAMGDLASMRSVIEAWAADVSGGQGSYPDESNIATVLNDKGIRWDEIKDPWGQPYVYYTKTEGNNVTGFAIVSGGPDKAIGGGDDIYVCDHTSPEKGTTDWLDEQGYEEASSSNE